MSMTDAEQTKAAQIAAAADKFIQGKEGIRQKLEKYGVQCSTGTPFVLYPGKVEALGQMSELSPTEALVTVNLNPEGATYWLPENDEDKAVLLNGAKLSLILHTGTTDLSYLVEVYALEGAACSFRLPGVTAPCSATVSARFGATAAGCVPVDLTVTPAQATTITMTTYKKRGIFRAFGRAQIFTGGANDALTSFPIVQTIEDGVATYAFGHYNASNQWVSTCGVKVDLGYWDETDMVAGVRTVDGDTSEGAVSLKNFLKAFSDIRVTTLKLGEGDGANDIYVELPAAYTKREKKTLTVETWDGGGAVASTQELTYIIHWIADEAYDSTWHLHTAFQRDVFNPTSGEYETPIDLDKILIQRYASASDGYSRPDGSIEAAGSQATWWTLYRAKNALKCTYTDKEGNTTEFAANGDERRFEGTGYKQISYIQLCAYLWLGANVQSKLQGICTATNRTSTYNGDSDVLLQNCGLFAGFCTTSGATKNYNPNDRTIVFMGFEDALWSSTGWIAGDVTAGYVTDENLQAIVELYYCRDPKYVMPSVGNKTTLLANGYTVIPANYLGGSNKRQIAETGMSVRDLFFPTNDATEENITVAATDNIWQTTAPTTASIKYQMVALGNYRNYGSYLGAFSLGAFNGLGNSAGAHWRSRSTCCLVA